LSLSLSQYLYSADKPPRRRKRGKSRPLLHLIDSNPPASVVSATTEAFSILGKSVTLEEGLAPAIKAASKLKGVGPATATYVLAAFRPKDVPVFSDDGYRWVMWEEGKGRGWDKVIKYTEKEYIGYFQGVGEVKERLKVNGEDVERCGFVLGKEAEGITAKARERQKLDAGTGDLKARRKAVDPPKANNGSAMPGNRQNKKVKATRASRQVPAHKSEMTTRPVRMLRSRTEVKE
jgi:hypothetical protein